MVKIYLFLIFAGFASALSAQQPVVHSSTVLPVDPNPGSQVKIVTHLETQSGAFLVDKTFSLNPTTKSIDLHLCYALNMLPVVSHHTDTFAVGQLAAGVYLVGLKAYLSGAGQYCAKVDSNGAAFSFTVANTDGINEAAGERISICPNPARDHIRIGSSKPATAKIYSALGQLLRCTEVPPNGIIWLHVLPAGMYLIEVDQGRRKSIHRLIVMD